MRPIFEAILAVSLISLSTAHAATESSCKQYVVIISPDKIKTQQNQDEAAHLIATPGLPILSQTSYFGTGRMYLVEMRKASHLKIIEALDAISGTLISCKVKYNTNP